MTPSSKLDDFLKAAAETPQPWNEVYQHPSAIGVDDALNKHFEELQRLEEKALNTSTIALNCPASCGLSEKEVQRYNAAAGLDVDVGVGSLIVALNALPGVRTLSSCTSFHEGAHEEEALVAITIDDPEIARELERRLGPKHFRPSREDVVVKKNSDDGAPPKKKRKKESNTEVVARFQSFIIFSSATLPNSSIDATKRFEDLIRLAKVVRSFALVLRKRNSKKSPREKVPESLTKDLEEWLANWSDGKYQEAWRQQLHDNSNNNNNNKSSSSSSKSSKNSSKSSSSTSPLVENSFALLENVFPKQHLEGVREELVSGLTGLRGMETSESCALVRPLLQAGLGVGEELRKSLPKLSKLLEALLTSKFRGALECVTGCKVSSTDQPRFSIIALPPGGFWAPQQVCGHQTQPGLSFVLFLVEEWWSEKDGGLLEVFLNSSAHAAKTIIPAFNKCFLYDASLCTAVSKVKTEEAPQLAIHAHFFREIGDSGTPPNSKKDEGDFEIDAEVDPENIGGCAEGEESTPAAFLDADLKEILKRAGVARKHLFKKSIGRCRSKFLEKSSLDLRGFLRSNLVAPLADQAKSIDSADFLPLPAHTSDPRDVDSNCGCSGGWSLSGPVQTKRHLIFPKIGSNNNNNNNNNSNSNFGSKKNKGKKNSKKAQPDGQQQQPKEGFCPVGLALRERCEALLENGAFWKFLEHCTGLKALREHPTTKQSATKAATPATTAAATTTATTEAAPVFVAEVRRFRPGLDYVRSTSSAASETTNVGNATSSSSSAPSRMWLDVTLSLGPKQRWQNLGGADIYSEKLDENAAESSGVGGGGGLIAGVDGMLPEVEPLQRSTPKQNCLRIVLRDSETVHGVEAVSRYANGSRWDLFFSVEVQPIDASDSEDEGEEESGDSDQDQELDASAQDDAKMSDGEDDEDDEEGEEESDDNDE